MQIWSTPAGGERPARRGPRSWPFVWNSIHPVSGMACRATSTNRSRSCEERLDAVQDEGVELGSAGARRANVSPLMWPSRIARLDDL